MYFFSSFSVRPNNMVILNFYKTESQDDRFAFSNGFRRYIVYIVWMTPDRPHRHRDRFFDVLSCILDRILPGRWRIGQFVQPCTANDRVLSPVGLDRPQGQRTIDGDRPVSGGGGEHAETAIKHTGRSRKRDRDTTSERERGSRRQRDNKGGGDISGSGAKGTRVDGFRSFLCKYPAQGGGG